MRVRCLSVALVLMAPMIAVAQEDSARAKTLAQEILDKGSAIFDSRDAAAMADTFIDAAEILLIKRSSDSSGVEIEAYRGRQAIEKGYADLFKDRRPEHRSRNTVDDARFLNPNLLLIHGRFALDREQGDSIQFVQIRAREGDRWKVVTMQLMELP